MKREYEIRNHGTRMSPRWSINQTSGGVYLSQTAFWFKSKGAALVRLNQIIIEDAADKLCGGVSEFVGVAYGEPRKDRAGHLVADKHFAERQEV